jgi:hypothetical protein
MANPGPYPPMGQMQPMGGPMGPMGMRPQVRQGTSHVVPVVVSAGLAVGVFCGLLFGLGTRHEAEPAKGTNGAKQSEESQVQTAAVTTGSKPPTTGSTASGGAASAGGAATGGAAPSTGNAAAATPSKPGKLTIDIKPDGAAQSAKIFIDGRQAAGTASDIPFDPGTKERTVKVVVQAAGYQEEQRDQTVKADEATSLAIQLRPAKAAVPTGGGDDKTAGKSDGRSDGRGDSKTDGARTDGARTGTGKTGTGKGSGGKGTGKGSGLIDI